MKIYDADEEDITCCHDTLKQEYVANFISGGYTHIRVCEKVYELNITHAVGGETIIMLWEEVCNGTA